MKAFLFRFIFALVLCMSIFTVEAQEKKIDSLKNLLLKVENERKVDVLIELSLEYFPDNPENQLKYAKQALEFAQTLNYEKGRGKAYNSLSLHYISVSSAVGFTFCKKYNAFPYFCFPLYTFASPIFPYTIAQLSSALSATSRAF